MLSINTNLSSLIAQNSLTQSTNKLNQAIERMSTGYKINHASDNAANYSISTNMTTKMSAYMVAEDNTAMGLDLVTTASEIISQMENKAERLRSLTIQAGNGTYGSQSMSAIQSEANALVQEITRLYLSSEYNGISLFDREDFSLPAHLVQAGKSGFIDETTPVADLEPQYDGFIVNPKTYDDATVNSMASIDSFTSGASGEFKIEDADDLVRLATLVNGGANTEYATFVLADDIDLTQWCATNGNWVPIGASGSFRGTFDGNGHIVSGLIINNPTSSVQGLFGMCHASRIKNVGIVQSSISAASSAGGLIGASSSSTFLDNCYSTADVKISGNYAGCLIGTGSNTDLKNCYATGNVESSGSTSSYIGGLAGDVYKLTNCYATGNVESSGSTSSYIGGLAGSVCELTNCFALGDVLNLGTYTGGLVGKLSGYGAEIKNCFAIGDVIGGNATGGLIGDASTSIVTDSYATGHVSGKDFTGGLIGQTLGSTNHYIKNCYATGDVEGESYVGGLLGYNSSGGVYITNCYATGDVSGENRVGGLIGHQRIIGNATFANNYATGDVSGNKFVGGFIGFLYQDYGSSARYLESSYALGEVVGNEVTGSFIGGIGAASIGSTGLFTTLNIADCYAKSDNSNMIGGTYDSSAIASMTYDMSDWLANISFIQIVNTDTTLQVGINGDEKSRITFNTNFQYDLSALEADITSENALSTIDKFISVLSNKQTELGAVTNRLESALDEIAIQYDNLASSRSTLRDADMAELSSEYIKMQILQQASATLLSTANQSPSIALQLI